MGVYLLIHDERESDAPTSLLVAAIVAKRLTPIADYELVAAVPEIGTVAELDNYPRWAEPGLALVARLLQRAEPSALPTPAPSKLSVVLAVGTAPRLLMEEERLDVEWRDEVMLIKAQARFASGVMVTTPPPPGSSVLVVARYAIHRSLLWPTEPPPTPRPLSEVVIHRQGPDSFVLASEVPSHPRLYLLHRLGMSFSTERIQAQAWHSFIDPDGAERGTLATSARH
jgi:hypothetical protein